MGYNTHFEGHFKITPPPTRGFVLKVDRFCAQKHDNDTMPGVWCDWLIGESHVDGTHTLSWNMGENFHNYVEWLQYLINRYFEPEGYKLNGTVRYQGENSDDFGKIVVNNNKVDRRIGRKVYD